METLRTHGNIANIWKQMHAQANTWKQSKHMYPIVCNATTSRQKGETQ